jgi:hypothetical protein
MDQFKDGLRRVLAAEKTPARVPSLKKKRKPK